MDDSGSMRVIDMRLKPEPYKNPEVTGMPKLLLDSAYEVVKYYPDIHEVSVNERPEMMDYIMRIEGGVGEKRGSAYLTFKMRELIEIPVDELQIKIIEVIDSFLKVQKIFPPKVNLNKGLKGE